MQASLLDLMAAVELLNGANLIAVGVIIYFVLGTGVPPRITQTGRALGGGLLTAPTRLLRAMESLGVVRTSSNKRSETSTTTTGTESILI